MKILYLAEWDAYSNSGVIRKIKAQFDTWRSLGVDARLVIVSPATVGKMPMLTGDGITVISHRVARFGIGKIFKALALRSAKKIVQEFSPDVIYYRQSSWTPGILGLLKTARSVVVEVNSNDVFEAHQNGWLKAKYHLTTRKWLIDRVKGFVCVGRDLGEFYKEYKKQVCVIGNGFDTNSVSNRPSPHNLRPQMVFVGSKGQAWHGVDKLLKLANDLTEMDFHIVGQDIKDAPMNVKSYGFLSWDKLANVYTKMDFGFGSLALHRIGIDEITPLKTREYLAYGLPVISAYHDIDLEACEYYLQLPNQEDGLIGTGDQIRTFVNKWKDRPIDRADVIARIDSTSKEKIRLSFLASMV